MDSFGINDAKFIIRMHEIRNWQSYCPVFSRDDQDFVDRFDRFVFIACTRNNRLIWLVQRFLQTHHHPTDLDTWYDAA